MKKKIIAHELVPKFSGLSERNEWGKSLRLLMTFTIRNSISVSWDGTVLLVAGDGSGECSWSNYRFSENTGKAWFYWKLLLFWTIVAILVF